MTVRIGRRGGKIVVDIRTQGPDRKLIRERRNAPDGITSESAARRWGERRQAMLVNEGQAVEAPEVSTLKDFATRWMKDYARANGNKPSTMAAKETINRLHLLPVLGAMHLDEIGELAVQRLKLHLEGKAEKTRACVLSQLATMLNTAERWEEIPRAPRIDLPRIPVAAMGFYDFAEWERLVGGAERAGSMVRAAILLGGDAGLRRGEIVALEQSDVGGGAVTVRRSEWKGHVGSPKGGKERRIPLTTRLEQALAAVKHLRGKRVLFQANGEKVGVTTLQSWLETSCRRAGLPESRNLHKLRHTFCSHLAMRGATPRAIQELAGHADLKTTQRYMHLSPAHIESAIRLLEQPAPGAKKGAELEQ